MLTFLFLLLATANIILSAWGLVTGAYWFFPVASYFIVRELLYKLFHLAGYHAEPDLREYANHKGSIFLPVFEKNTTEYLQVYAQRSKSLQVLYLLGQIIWGSLFLWSLVLSFAALLFFIGREESKTKEFVFVAFLLLAFALFTFLFFKLKKFYLILFRKLFKADILLYEHSQPIFAKKKKK